jgi:small subunit ribosomal protein S2
MSIEISMKALLESGVHFGHRTNRWDPRMKPYIFTERNGIHIIDLQQTVQRLKKAYELVRDQVAAGGTVLFVGTKRQAQETIQMEAERCGMPYVIERWLPGTLTNWMTIHQRIMELERLEKMRDSGELDRLVKKEGLMIERKIKRLLVHLSGIRHMNGVPDMIFVVDISREDTAVHEANLKKIPVVAMVDTNCNPENIDYIIPGNDDAIRAIKLMVGKMADAVIEGKDMRKEDEMELEGGVPIQNGDDDRLRGRVTLEEDIDDEVLLGESTLQKLAESKREEEEAAAAEEDDVVDESTDESTEETPEESEEETAEEDDVVDESADESVDESAEETPEESEEETAEEDEVVEESADESVDESAEETPEESEEETAEEDASDEDDEEE